MLEFGHAKRRRNTHLVVDTNARINDVDTYALTGRIVVNVRGVVCEIPRALVGDSSKAPGGSMLRYVAGGADSLLPLDVIDL